MLVDEMPRSFLKRNNSYSHCPLKKRPVHVMLGDEASSSAPIKEEMVEVLIVDDVIPEPENLSTKPEDLSRRTAAAAERIDKNSETTFPTGSCAPTIVNQNIALGFGINASLLRSPSPASASSSSPSSSPAPSQTIPTQSELLLRSLRRSPSPSAIPSSVHSRISPPPPPPAPTHHHHHHHHHGHHYPMKTITPPAGIVTPLHLHQLPKKAKVEVLQHDNTNSSALPVGTQHFITNAGPNQSASTAAATPLEPLNLNTPVEPLPRYATPAWARAAPLFPPHYLPYPAAYRYQPSELYPAYPIAGGAVGGGGGGGGGYSSHSHSPEHVSVSPPPHGAALTCPTIQRPVARAYAPWGSPDHCGLSPTSSLGSGSLRSPPPVTPEDLSSPGSDSGRSSAGSTSAGPIVGGQKMIEKNSSTSSPRYQCPDCGKSYSTYSGLSKHQQFHCAAAEGQTKKSFSCKYCEKVYVSLGALKMHIRTHTLPCKCHLCGKAFSRPWLLQGHIRTHTGEKPFSCQHCNRAFADRSNLRAHLQTHSDVKKYSCSSCSKTFSRMSLLTKHQEGGCPGIAVPIAAYGC